MSVAQFSSSEHGVEDKNKTSEMVDAAVATHSVMTSSCGQVTDFSAAATPTVSTLVSSKNKTKAVVESPTENTSLKRLKRLKRLKEKARMLFDNSGCQFLEDVDEELTIEAILYIAK